MNDTAETRQEPFVSISGPRDVTSASKAAISTIGSQKIELQVKRNGEHGIRTINMDINHLSEEGSAMKPKETEPGY